MISRGDIAVFNYTSLSGTVVSVESVADNGDGTLTIKGTTPDAKSVFKDIKTDV